MIFENQLATKGDPWISKQQHCGQFSYFQDELYIWLRSEDRSDRDDFVRQGAGWNSLGFFCADVEITSDSMTSEVLSRLAKSVIAVVVEAFDGDGYVSWTPDREANNEPNLSTQ